MLAKDAVLNELAERCNIAQFVSFAPDKTQRFARINCRQPNEIFSSPREACKYLLRAAESGAVNVRSFRPGDTKGQRLIQNLRSVPEIISAINERASKGFFTIANELIPLDDGGVSGVTIGNVIEFAPADTPKCVEKPGIASLPLAKGQRFIELVYGFSPKISFGSSQRVEFSLHPIRRGIRNEHTIIWEVEPAASLAKGYFGKWPNRFSRFIGDKTYGLLVAELLGFNVPRTTVLNRNIAPFTFGKTTGTNETWIRTAPRVPIAGKYPTYFGWTDPFKLMEGPNRLSRVLPTILAQESVSFAFSGAAQTAKKGPVVEGRLGRGDAFMLGEVGKERIPESVYREVLDVHNDLTKELGPVKFEWVWDSERIWIVQLHARARGVSSSVIYPGKPTKYVRFNVARGLESLRELIARVKDKNTGIILVGQVGVTSHLGDILGEAQIPSYLERTDN
jgi:hypothetical protein